VFAASVFVLTKVLILPRQRTVLPP
jgi:hypothetical protein